MQIRAAMRVRRMLMSVGESCAQRREGDDKGENTWVEVEQSREINKIREKISRKNDIFNYNHVDKKLL